MGKRRLVYLYTSTQFLQPTSGRATQLAKRFSSWSLERDEDFSSRERLVLRWSREVWSEPNLDEIRLPTTLVRQDFQCGALLALTENELIAKLLGFDTDGGDRFRALGARVGRLDFQRLAYRDIDLCRVCVEEVMGDHGDGDDGPGHFSVCAFARAGRPALVALLLLMAWSVMMVTALI